MRVKTPYSKIPDNNFSPKICYKIMLIKFELDTLIVISFFPFSRNSLRLLSECLCI